VTDNFDPDRLFEALRDSTRRAPVAPAADVRRRGHQRAVRARIVYATTAVVLITGGAGAAFAAGQDRADRQYDPGKQTPPVTSSPSPTATPSPIATSAVPTVGAQPGGSVVAAAPRTHKAPVTPTTTRAHTSAPVTTTKAAPTTTPVILTTAPTEYMTGALIATGGKGSITWSASVSGMVAQTYDAGTKQAVPGANQFENFVLYLDGANIDGGESGDVNCPSKSPIVHAHLDFTPKTVSAKPGVHHLSIRVRSCDRIQLLKTVTVTVH